jgi:hypothetical protein
MQGSSGTHGPQRDDALRRQTADELRAGRVTRAEEWRDPEPPADDEPDVTWALSGRLAPDADTIALRSDLARNLDRGSFPATGANLADELSARQAPQRLIDLVNRLPQDQKFDDLTSVLHALGLGVSAEDA